MKRVDILIKAYVQILRIHYDDHFRLTNQVLYASLRDKIAEDLKIEAESVQNMCEALARTFND